MTDEMNIEVPGAELPQPEPEVIPEAPKKRMGRPPNPKPEDVGVPIKGRWQLFEDGWYWVGPEQENA